MHSALSVMRLIIKFTLIILIDKSDDRLTVGIFLQGVLFTFLYFSFKFFMERE